MPVQGAAESHLGHKFGALSSYQFHEACQSRIGQYVAGDRGRKWMTMASCQLCFFSKTGINSAEWIEKGHPKSRKNMPCFLLLYCYLVASCRQKRKGRQRALSKKISLQLVCLITLNVLPVCVQLDNLLMGEWAPSATCTPLGLVLKCLFQDPLSRVEVMKKHRDLLPACICMYYAVYPRQSSCSA